jgi:murein DD-endopeptidase MepM/ murein hydrolase activator NlpD
MLAAIALGLLVLPGDPAPRLEWYGNSTCALDASLEGHDVEGGIILTARLPGVLDATIDVTARLDNLVSDPPLPATLDVRDGQPRELIRLRRERRLREGQYESLMASQPGGRGGQHDPQAVYALPFDEGVPVIVIQGAGGAISHAAGSGSEHAVDLSLPEAGTVRAARDGIVVARRDDAVPDDRDPTFGPCGNYVTVRQADGTYAGYHHLAQGSLRVQLGQAVPTGRALGLTATSPHGGAYLHFEVFRTLDGKRRESFPLRFETREGVVELRERQQYHSP